MSLGISGSCKYEHDPSGCGLNTCSTCCLLARTCFVFSCFRTRIKRVRPVTETPKGYHHTGIKKEYCQIEH